MIRYLARFSLACFCATAAARATEIVFLDFNATWNSHLTSVATTAGVPDFDSAERALIQSNIQQAVDAVYGAFDIDLTMTNPGGTYNRVNFGATTGTAGLYGQAPVDFRNQSHNQTASVYSHNFSGFIENGESRSQQIAELSGALASVTAHEMGHFFGMRHHAAYGDPAITPANYSNTGSIQNTHIMGTGPTGQSESQWEGPHVASQWENVLLEAGSGLSTGGAPLVFDFIESTDVGGSPATAQSVNLTDLAISQTRGGMVKGSIPSVTDVDMFSFYGYKGAKITAETWSEDRHLDYFNTMLDFYHPNGVSVLASNNDIYYSGNQFNAVTKHENDSFLLNISLPMTGWYYFRVRTAGSGATATGNYDLVFASSLVAPPLDGDVDEDSDVDFDDFLSLQVGYGTVAGALRSDGDLDNDFDVDFQDFLVLQVHFGDTSDALAALSIASSASADAALRASDDGPNHGFDCSCAACGGTFTAATVPEPHTLALFGIGLLLLGGARRSQLAAHRRRWR